MANFDWSGASFDEKKAFFSLVSGGQTLDPNTTEDMLDWWYASSQHAAKQQQMVAAHTIPDASSDAFDSIVDIGKSEIKAEAVLSAYKGQLKRQYRDEILANEEIDMIVGVYRNFLRKQESSLEQLTRRGDGLFA